MKKMNANLKLVIAICLIGAALLFIGWNFMTEDEKEEPKRLLDREFVQDSRIRINTVNRIQQKNLFVLAKVWGYVKYRHPSITDGSINWDAELFRVMPDVLNARNCKDAEDRIFSWLNKFSFEQQTFTEKAEELYKKNLDNQIWETDESWIFNEELLGKKLSGYLQRLAEIKVTNTKNGYASFETGSVVSPVNVSNDKETGINMKYVDSGMRLLALFRYWNIIEYFYPYKDIIGEDWNKVLFDKIPELALGVTQKTYTLSMAELIMRIHDSHGFFADSYKILNQYFGYFLPEVKILNIKGKFVVGVAKETSQLQPGDIILEIDGESIIERLDKCKKYISVSNISQSANAFMPYLLGTKNKQANIKIQRNGKIFEIQVIGKYNADYSISSGMKGNKSSGFLKKDKIGYLNMDRLELGDIDKYMKKFEDTQGIIVDLRYDTPNYAFLTLAEYFKSKPQIYSQIYGCNTYEPGKFSLMEFSQSGNGFLQQMLNGEKRSLKSKLFFYKAFDNGLFRTLAGKVKKRDRYKGKVVLLMNEWTQSQLEYTVMSLKDAENAIIVGSTSAGTDGNIVKVNLPGSIVTYFSGLAITYPDGTQTQRIGLQPDIWVQPTIKGLANGKDELIDRAIKVILENERKGKLL